MRCEWNPETERPARTTDRWHGRAEIVVKRDGRRFFVCESCFHRCFPYSRRSPIPRDASARYGRSEIVVAVEELVRAAAKEAV